MGELQIFPSKEFGNIRTMLIDGKEYFCGNDVASALCYQVPKDAVSRHCKGATVQRPLGESQDMKYIPVGDVYRLIVKAGSQSNNKEIKAKAERFERLVFDEILPQIHETGSYGIPKDTDGKIALLAQGHSELRTDINNVRVEVENLKNELPILPLEADRITAAVKAKGVSVMGGKESAAYRNRSLVNAVYKDIYREIYRNFGVTTYKAIKRNQCEKALEVVEKYQLPVILRERVENLNTQLSLDLEGGAC